MVHVLCDSQTAGWRCWLCSGCLKPRRGSEQAGQAEKTLAPAIASTPSRSLTASSQWPCLRSRGTVGVLYIHTHHEARCFALSPSHVLIYLGQCDWMACFVFFCVRCRCNLAGVMLQLMALGIPDVMNFDFMSKPSPGTVLLYMNHSAPPFILQGCRFTCVCLS